MRRNTAVMMLFVLVLASISCSVLRQGADPVLTRAEQTYDVAFWSVTALFQAEKAIPEIDKLVPGSHAAVEKMRMEAPAIFMAGMNALDAYRLSKGDKQKADLTDALAVIQVLANDASSWLTKINKVKEVK